jgi:hypothetical protein
VDSSLASLPFFFGTRLLAAVILAQRIRLRDVLRKLIFKPFPKISVQCLDCFEVHQNARPHASLSWCGEEREYALVPGENQAVSAFSAGLLSVLSAILA